MSNDIPYPCSGCMHYDTTNEECPCEMGRYISGHHCEDFEDRRNHGLPIPKRVPSVSTVNPTRQDTEKTEVEEQGVFVDHGYRCPKCMAGTFVTNDGMRFCANLGGFEDDGCDWNEQQPQPKKEITEIEELKQRILKTEEEITELKLRLGLAMKAINVLGENHGQFSHFWR